MNPLNEFLVYLDMWAHLQNELNKLGVGKAKHFEWGEPGSLSVAYHEPSVRMYETIYNHTPVLMTPVYHADFKEFVYVSNLLGKGWGLFIAPAPEIHTVYWYLGDVYLWWGTYWRRWGDVISSQH